MPRPQDIIARHAQRAQRTAAAVRGGGSSFVSEPQGRAETLVAAWDISTWDKGVFGPGGELTWDDSDFGGGDTFAAESTGHTGRFDFDYWRRCQFGA
jgi:hypothetical protein